MAFHLSFNTDSDAFREDAKLECSRILKSIAEQLERRRDEGPILDLNGNRIGRWRLL